MNTYYRKVWASIYDGYLYLQGVSSKTWFRINASNPADVTAITKAKKAIDYEYVYPAFAVNGRVYFETHDESYMTNEDRGLIYNPEDNILKVIEARHFVGQDGYSVTPLFNYPYLFYTGNTIRMLGNYLATINNLDTPVTKTADKTMKVTYILQDHV